MQLTAIGTVTIMIVLLGTFLFAQETVGKVGSDIVRRIEISVFLKETATPSDARALILAVRADPAVKNVVYIPKSEGLQQMRERLRGQIDTSLLTGNPLPDALRVRVANPDNVHTVAERIAKLPNVQTVEYQRDAVERLLRLSDVIGKIGLGFIILLVLTAAIIISNTIRLTVYARRREIAIMQLVGASSIYIRLPFICEGFIDGFLGALLALLLLSIGRWQLWPKLLGALPFIPLHDSGIDLVVFALQLLGVGAAVGIVASWISVGRYLRT
jgi:cell division transport system permease protein